MLPRWQGPTVSVGWRGLAWVRESGGVRPRRGRDLAGRYLSFAKREEIAFPSECSNCAEAPCQLIDRRDLTPPVLADAGFRAPGWRSPSVSSRTDS